MLSISALLRYLGHSCQSMAGYLPAQSFHILTGNQHVQETVLLHFGEGMHPHKLADILPERFGPHSLLAAGQQMSLLLQPQFHDVHLASGRLPSQIILALWSLCCTFVGQA